MSKFMSKAKSVLGSVFFRWTSSRTSSRAGFDMEVDPLTFTIGSSSRQRWEVLYTLLRDNHIKFEDDREKKIYKQLKDREFTLTPVIDPDLRQSVGMDSEFELIFRNIGWENA
jgi:hypothetical protein